MTSIKEELASLDVSDALKTKVSALLDKVEQDFQSERIYPMVAGSGEQRRNAEEVAKETQRCNRLAEQTTLPTLDVEAVGGLTETVVLRAQAGPRRCVFEFTHRDLIAYKKVDGDDQILGELLIKHPRKAVGLVRLIRWVACGFKKFIPPPPRD